MKKLVLVIICCLFASSAFAAPAETRGFQLSFIPDIAIHSKTTYIKGFSLGVWNENPQTGVALGFVNGAMGDSTGLLWGWVGNYAENYKGVQVSPFVNYNEGSLAGLQSALFNYAGSLKGLQLGMINFTKTAEAGVQVGLVNIISDNEWFKKFPGELAPGMVFVNWKFK